MIQISNKKVSVDLVPTRLLTACYIVDWVKFFLIMKNIQILLKG